MTRDNIANPASSANRAHLSANEKRPAASPSAQELVAQASAARAALDTKTLNAAGGDEQSPPLAPDGIEVEENASPRDELPTMEELEVARDNLSKKIAAEGADGKD
ncbi:MULTISPECIES: hypothetical protein [Rhizobium]|uniref:Uncharacterized protein n=1 Tax=Rhizobium favelukesii TaxID=348824 RepID=W6RKD4_9HYPH|nr:MULTISPECIES: hypothetical protein [Rhizobium]MCA0806602.1 hypothetical protein [Rhizobium sp. T1473]MCS0459799.1 hypothetical protein [Rhizobium favelukesii]UFS85303.1 hypothetical protein LPB79_37235 [Rhizobium sp. T136]CDM61319.1 hypothetical protein LPU83_pLPU83c_0757 [Rhizobium favelukesii]